MYKSSFRLIFIIFLIINLFVLDISIIFEDEFIAITNKIHSDPVTFIFGTWLEFSNFEEFYKVIFIYFLLILVVWSITYLDKKLKANNGKIITYWLILVFVLLTYFRSLFAILELALYCDNINKCNSLNELLKHAGLAYIYGSLITFIYEVTLFFFYFKLSKHLEDLHKILFKIAALIIIFIIILIAFTHLNYSHVNFPFIGTHCLLGSLLTNEIINFYRTKKKDPSCPNVPT